MGYSGVQLGILWQILHDFKVFPTKFGQIWDFRLGFSRPQDFFSTLFKKIFPVFSDFRHPNVYISVKKNIRFIGTLNDQFIVKHGKFGIDSVSIGHK